MATKTTTKRKPAKPPATTEATPAVLEVGSEEWKAEVRKARARILGGRKADPDKSLERAAELVAEHDEAARRGDTKECEKIRRWLTDTAARNQNWIVDDDGNGTVETWSQVQIAVLMDIRRTLETIQDRLPPKETA